MLPLLCGCLGMPYEAPLARCASQATPPARRRHARWFVIKTFQGLGRLPRASTRVSSLANGVPGSSQTLQARSRSLRYLRGHSKIFRAILWTSDTVQDLERASKTFEGCLRTCTDVPRPYKGFQGRPRTLQGRPRTSKRLPETCQRLPGVYHLFSKDVRGLPRASRENRRVSKRFPMAPNGFPRPLKGFQRLPKRCQGVQGFQRLHTCGGRLAPTIPTWGGQCVQGWRVSAVVHVCRA